jgi:hypothetical protein
MLTRTPHPLQTTREICGAVCSAAANTHVDWGSQVMGVVVPAVLLRAVTWHEPDLAGWWAGQLGFTPQQPPAGDRCQWR